MKDDKICKTCKYFTESIWKPGEKKYFAHDGTCEGRPKNIIGGNPIYFRDFNDTCNQHDAVCW